MDRFTQVAHSLFVHPLIHAVCIAFIHGLFLKGRPDLAARIHKRAGESTAARGPHTDDHHKEKEDYSDILQRLPHLGSAGRVVREDADLLAAAVAMVEALDETNDDDWDDDGEDEDPRMEHNGTNSASVATMLIATNNVASGAPPHFQAAVVDPSRRLPEPGMESLPMGTNLCGMLVHIAANRFVAGGDNEQQQQQHDQDRRFGPNAAVLNVLHQAMIEGLFPFDLDGEDDDHHHHHNDWMAYG